MILIRAVEVKGRKTHECRECGRPIRENEYKTKLVYWSPDEGRCWSEYSCCSKPHQYRVGYFYPY